MPTDIVPVEVAALAVAPAATPEDIIQKATQAANVLKPIIEAKKLSMKMGQKEYPYAEAWACLLGLLGVDPILAWSKRLEREKGIVYESRMELYKNGQLIGAGEALASSEETGTWARKEYSIKSMSQTRAFGKAARLKFAWIMVMAGYAPTPAEEMPDQPERPSVPMPKEKPTAISGITLEERKVLFAKAEQALGPHYKESLKRYLLMKFKTEHTAQLSQEMYYEVLAYLEDLIEVTPPHDAA